jgi:biopolymer transport protein ExbD
MISIGITIAVATDSRKSADVETPTNVDDNADESVYIVNVNERGQYTLANCGFRCQRLRKSPEVAHYFKVSKSDSLKLKKSECAANGTICRIITTPNINNDEYLTIRSNVLLRIGEVKTESELVTDD